MIDEQHAVQMVNLMLDAGRQQPLAMQHLLIAINIDIAHIDMRRAFDICGLTRD